MAGSLGPVHLRYGELSICRYFYPSDIDFGCQTYFFLGAEHRSLRFTQTPKTFCIISLERPAHGYLEIDTLIPVAEGDSIFLLGGGRQKQPLELTWSRKEDKLVIEVEEEAVSRVDHAWAFLVLYAMAIPSPP